MSYQAALNKSRASRDLIPGATILVTLWTVAIWCVTAYQAAQMAGAHTWHDVLVHIINNAITIQPHDEQAISSVLIAYGAKDNTLIMQGQYWRFLVPIFLHANALHVGLNMLNFFVLGVFLERLLGFLRFSFIYIITGVASVIASFCFAPQAISVGASGAIFGLIGAYSVFVLVHHQAFPCRGAFDVCGLIIVIGVNLGIGYFIPNVDNYAHIGGLLSGLLLGWWFTPLYRVTPPLGLIDVHSFSRRWLLALLTVLGTLVVAMIAIYLFGKSSL